MSVVILVKELTKEDVLHAREEYDTYIKITIDLDQKLVAIGGEYHADAQDVLIREYGGKKNIWGGGYSLLTKQFETNAMVNIHPETNPAMEILNPKIREEFLKIAKEKLKDIEKFI